jgi:hypothetical protein
MSAKAFGHGQGGYSRSFRLLRCIILSGRESGVGHSRRLEALGLTIPETPLATADEVIQ